MDISLYITITEYKILQFHSLINRNIVSIAKLPSYKMNKTLQGY